MIFLMVSIKSHSHAIVKKIFLIVLWQNPAVLLTVPFKVTEIRRIVFAEL